MSEVQSKTRSTPLTAGSELLQIFRYLLRWVPIAALVGVMAGTASALLLVSLVWATDTRESHKWLIALLPLGGLFVGCLYKYLGTSVEAGNNLILDEIHDPKRTIPIRMTPLILLGTFCDAPVRRVPQDVREPQSRPGPRSPTSSPGRSA